jgi:ubiquinone biosynthesis protein
VAEVCRRFQRAQHYADFSLATMILESVSLGGQYRVYFPVEMVLMTKALITFEGVGKALQPDFDVAKVSQKYVNDLFFTQFNPLQLVKESLRGAPELVDLAVRAPLVLSEAFSALEQRLRKPPENPFAGLKPALLSGFSLVGGSVIAGLGGPWPLWVALYGLAALFALGSRKSE